MRKQLMTLLFFAVAAQAAASVPKLIGAGEQRGAAALDPAATAAKVEMAEAETPTRCFTDAYRRLPRAQALALCAGGGTADTARCYAAAHRWVGMEPAVRLCAHRGTLATAACFNRAFPAMGADGALSLCARRT